MRCAVLASGSGTILEAILDAGLPIEMVVVDRPCRALKIAGDHGVAGFHVERSSFGPEFDRHAYTAELTELLVANNIDLVIMAGFGTVFAQPIYEAFEGRIINTHPSLLPSFPGWHAVQAALDYGVKVTGCTVHVATLAVDSGPILAQSAVAVEPGDTDATLHERIKAIERGLYLDTIEDILERGYVLPAAATADCSGTNPPPLNKETR